ncbi:unnamed protein product [Periconia digitata]|uniref:Uncharacterized protein n=1 Tax=Periconia digitata TaxID=1303443 RepID=A0A9W4XLL1_9PLEO|nr:unnamed protein product [Periconia digitata]
MLCTWHGALLRPIEGECAWNNCGRLAQLTRHQPSGVRIRCSHRSDPDPDQVQARIPARISSCSKPDIADPLPWHKSREKRRRRSNQSPSFPSHLWFGFSVSSRRSSKCRAKSWSSR